jgi:adenylate kinase
MAEESNKDKLTRLRAEAKALVDAREVKAAAAADDRELAQAEQDLADEQALTDAIAKYGALGDKIQAVKTDAGLVIVKKPNHVAFRRFQDDTTKSMASVEVLVRPCVVYPTGARLDQMLEDRPAILSPGLSDAVCLLAGIETKRLAGK